VYHLFVITLISRMSRITFVALLAHEHLIPVNFEWRMEVLDLIKNINENSLKLKMVSSRDFTISLLNYQP